ncbi:hypothetical protein RN001_005252 [Aquatica leii]|uniref:Uncharacterized protein n=1 Tax=Aquatica leii TaxID=1421715 RepID=A0AAN7PCI3_9COLE|nr:hypothetical protein RN001_005252 [Aquatica leii]
MIMMCLCLSLLTVAQHFTFKSKIKYMLICISFLHFTHTINTGVISLGQENHVGTVCLPPHSLHKMHLLDLSFISQVAAALNISISTVSSVSTAVAKNNVLRKNVSVVNLWKSLKDVYWKNKKEYKQGTGSSARPTNKWEHMDALAVLETTKTFRQKTTTEKIFNTLSKEREGRTKLMTKIESVILEESGKPHSLKLFFSSMAVTVMAFPPALAVRAKMKVLQIITELELENCGEHRSSTYSSSSINSYSFHHTDTTSYSASNSVEAPFNYTDSTGYVAPNCDETHGNKNCASLFSNF